ncbi:MAG: hypothetical protein ABI680_08205, partial [Chthoniobacteraceae bacterium]
MKGVIQIAAPIVAGVLGFYFGRLEKEVGASPVEADTSSGAHSASANSATGDRDDPEIVALLTALREPRNLREIARAGELLEGLNPEQMRRFMDRISDWPVPERESWLPVLLASWTQLDPQSATEWITPSLERYARSDMFGKGFANFDTKLVEAWTVNAPELAIEYARNNSGTKLAELLLHNAIDRLPGRDDGARFAILRGFPEGEMRRKVLTSFFYSWAQTGRDAAFAAAVSLPPGAERDGALGQVLARWASADANAVFKQVEALGIDNPGLLAIVTKEAAKSDPAATARWLEDQDATEKYQLLGAVVVKFWAERDPAAAFDWAEKRGISPLETPSADALEIPADRLNDRMELNGDPFQTAFARKPEAAIAWLRSLPSGPERDRYAELALRYADPERVQSLFDDLPPDAAVRSAGRFASLVALKNREMAQDWASSVANPEARAAAWAAIGAQREEPLPLPPGPDRDAMLSGLAYSRAASGLETAFARMLEIG